MPKKATGLRLSDEMLAEVTALANELGLTVSDIIRMAIKEYLKKER